MTHNLIVKHEYGQSQVSVLRALLNALELRKCAIKKIPSFVDYVYEHSIGFYPQRQHFEFSIDSLLFVVCVYSIARTGS